MNSQPHYVHTPRNLPLSEARCQASWKSRRDGTPIHPSLDTPPPATRLYISPFDTISLYCDDCAEEVLISALAVQKVLIDGGLRILDDTHVFTQYDELLRGER